jgi:hypothetical protein
MFEMLKSNAVLFRTSLLSYTFAKFAIHDLPGPEEMIFLIFCVRAHACVHNLSLCGSLRLAPPPPRPFSSLTKSSVQSSVYVSLVISPRHKHSPDQIISLLIP